MENNTEKIFSALKEEISTYAGLKLQLLKLMAIERGAGILSALSHGLMLLLFAFFTILFLFLALGFFLGDLLGSVALGFLVVSVIYLMLIFAFMAARKRICMRLMNAFVKILQTNDEDEEDDEKDRATDTARTTAAAETENPVAVPGNGRGN